MTYRNFNNKDRGLSRLKPGVLTRKEIIEMQKTPNILEKQFNPLMNAINKCKSAFWITFWFAFVINLLMLITPLYSLQVLDRVIGSGSIETLLMLSLVIGLIYFIYGLLQIARSFTLIKIGEWLDNNLSPIIFGHAISSTATRVNVGASSVTS